LNLFSTYSSNAFSNVKLISKFREGLLWNFKLASIREAWVLKKLADDISDRGRASIATRHKTSSG
jgi:hypothetical protein